MEDGGFDDVCPTGIPEPPMYGGRRTGYNVLREGRPGDSFFEKKRKGNEYLAAIYGGHGFSLPRTRIYLGVKRGFRF